MMAHGAFEDPSAKEDSVLEKEAAFVETARYLRNQIAAYVERPVMSVAVVMLRAGPRMIGCPPGAFHKAG